MIECADCGAEFWDETELAYVLEPHGELTFVCSKCGSSEVWEKEVED